MREHDCDPDKYPQIVHMLDVAHMTFNAVTGVSSVEEKRERRAFRSVCDWRNLFSAVGLCDTLLYEVDPRDPTYDEMMCFYKPPLWSSAITRPHEGTAMPHTPFLLPSTQQQPLVLPRAAKVIQAAPELLLGVLKEAVRQVSQNLPSFISNVVEQLSMSLTEGQRHVLTRTVENNISPIFKILERFTPRLESVTLNQGTVHTE